MRYPVRNFLTEWNTNAGLGFGEKTPYGFHEGADINDNSGGNSDLGKEILAIANGDLVYWHGAKHSNSGFGYHSVYKIEGQWGVRWVHQAHCMPDITQAPKAVVENEVIAKVGNSGTKWAHIHFAIFKVDPVTLPDGIDTIARTEKQLNDWWENPLPFIDRWMNSWTHENQQKLINELRTERDKNWNLYTAEKDKNNILQSTINGKQTTIDAQIREVDSLKKTLEAKINEMNAIKKRIQDDKAALQIIISRM